MMSLDESANVQGQSGAVRDGDRPTNGAASLTRWTAVLAGMLVLILVPFFIFEDSLTEFGTALLQSEVQKPLLAVLVAGLLASDVLLPVPSSLVSSFAGHMLGFAIGLLAVWSGMTLGCLIGYWIGASGGAALVRKVVGDRELARAHGLAARYGACGLVVARAVPVLAEASVVFAGVARFPVGRFLVATGLSNLGIAVAYTAIGAYSYDVSSFLWAFAGAIAVPAAGMAIARIAIR
jgi:membrane protein DedA with SNARE-associated domain